MNRMPAISGRGSVFSSSFFGATGSEQTTQLPAQAPKGVVRHGSPRKKLTMVMMMSRVPW